MYTEFHPSWENKFCDIYFSENADKILFLDSYFHAKADENTKKLLFAKIKYVRNEKSSRQSQRQTERKSERETNRLRGRQTEVEKQRETQSEKLVVREKKQTERHIVRETDRHKDRQT